MGQEEDVGLADVYDVASWRGGAAPGKGDRELSAELGLALALRT
jgi:hypothetical protein